MKLSTIITLALIVLVAAGVVITMNGVGFNVFGQLSNSANNCYNAVNAAGQVVSSVCY
jgi:hypothetical protein